MLRLFMISSFCLLKDFFFLDKRLEFSYNRSVFVRGISEGLWFRRPFSPTRVFAFSVSYKICQAEHFNAV